MKGKIYGIGGGAEKITVTFNTTPSEAIVTLRDRDGKEVQAINNKVYKIPKGLYYYDIKASGYRSVENIEVKLLEDETIDIELQDIKLIPFSDLTNEELEKMLNAHYNGEIDISDYWHVGDTRLIHINATVGLSDEEYSGKISEQDMTFVILDFNHDDLVTQSGERTKAAVTLQCKTVLADDGYPDEVYYWGSSHVTTNTDNWNTTPMRTWINNNFIQALPTILQPLIKQVKKKNLSTHTGTSTINTQDKAFWLSYPEIFGTSTYTYYKGTNQEGTQYKYFKTEENRIKAANINGKGEGTNREWWLRSPSSHYSSSLGYSWCTVNTNGTVNNDTTYSSDCHTIAPAFCL